VARQAILGSIGGALAVAKAAGGQLGELLAAAARHAFVDGMDLALLVGAAVVGVSALLVVVALPNRATGARVDPGGAAGPDAGPDQVPGGSAAR